MSESAMSCPVRPFAGEGTPAVRQSSPGAPSSPTRPGHRELSRARSTAACIRVIPITHAASATARASTGALRWPSRSRPRSRAMAHASAEAGCPAAASVPAEAKIRGSSAYRARARTSANGLRQVLPVHTKTIRLGMVAFRARVAGSER